MRIPPHWHGVSVCHSVPSGICWPSSANRASLPPPNFPGHPGSDFPDDLIQQTLAFRDQHHDWGAELIRIMLHRLQRWQRLPDARTIRRWLHANKRPTAPGGRRGSHRPRSLLPHERWQVDAADQMRLGNGQLVSWLRLTDECSGAILGTVVFDCVFNQVPPDAVRQALRGGWQRWGLPQSLRLDNGWPWGGWFDLPTPLALDLAGLGLQLHYNDPRSPRQNAVVERSHQTSQNWVEPSRCADAEQLQSRLEQMDQIQREHYPHQGVRSRLQKYPDLSHSTRPYEPSQENWQLQRCREYLASHVGQRQVSDKGQVWVYGRRYQVGRVNRGKSAVVQYDPQSNEWLFSSSAGVLWCKQPAEQITAQHIRALDLLTDRRGKT